MEKFKFLDMPQSYMMWAIQEAETGMYLGVHNTPVIMHSQKAALSTLKYLEEIQTKHNLKTAKLRIVQLKVEFSI